MWQSSNVYMLSIANPPPTITLRAEISQRRDSPFNKPPLLFPQSPLLLAEPPDLLSWKCPFLLPIQLTKTTKATSPYSKQKEHWKNNNKTADRRREINKNQNPRENDPINKEQNPKRKKNKHNRSRFDIQTLVGKSSTILTSSRKSCSRREWRNMNKQKHEENKMGS